jgi:NAD(P)-dependent dehydrogenase (short-subunit alcohol dehydrogenase family)
MTDTVEITAEEIARHFSAAMDSVALLNAGKPEDTTDEDWADCVSRNVEHLKIMVAKDFMQGQDLAPLNAAIEANS